MLGLGTRARRRLISFCALLLTLVAVGGAAAEWTGLGRGTRRVSAVHSLRGDGWIQTAADPLSAAGLGDNSGPAAPLLIDLNGARIVGAEALQPAGRQLRVRWIGPLLSAGSGTDSAESHYPAEWNNARRLHKQRGSLHSPSLSSAPLLFSVFGEWAAEGGAGDRNGAAVRSTSVRLCHSVRSARPSARLHADSPPAAAAAATAAGECLIDVDSLPRGVTVTLRLLTECDYERWTAEAAAAVDTDDRSLSAPRRCLSSVSAPWTVTLPLLGSDGGVSDSVTALVEPSTRSQSHSQTDATPVCTSVHAATGVTLVQDDAMLREDLCAFFNLTGGDSWNSNDGWCDPDVSVCNWYGLKCNDNHTAVVNLELPFNELRLVRSTGNINFVWRRLTALTTLDLSNNGFLGSLNLTQLVNLQWLTLSGCNCVAEICPPWSPLPLPAVSALLSIGVSKSSLWVDLRRTPLLQSLVANFNQAPSNSHPSGTRLRSSRSSSNTHDSTVCCPRPTAAG